MSFRGTPHAVLPADRRHADDRRRRAGHAGDDPVEERQGGREARRGARDGAGRVSQTTSARPGEPRPRSAATRRWASRFRPVTARRSSAPPRARRRATRAVRFLVLRDSSGRRVASVGGPPAVAPYRLDLRGPTGGVGSLVGLDDDAPAYLARGPPPDRPRRRAGRRRPARPPATLDVGRRERAGERPLG